MIPFKAGYLSSRMIVIYLILMVHYMLVQINPKLLPDRFDIAIVHIKGLQMIYNQPV